jgi:transaldolase
MKLFLDTADIALVKTWKDTGLIDGVTTNPSHLSKIQKNPTHIVRALCELLPEGDISVEVTEKEPTALYQQAHKIAAIAPNITVKIPCHRDYYEVIKQLVLEGVSINVTLVFTVMQAALMGKLGVRYVSPFIGRWDELGIDGSSLLGELRPIFDRYQFHTKILAASLRTLCQVRSALCAGVDVITVSEHILAKMTTHALTEQGIALFDIDWKQIHTDHFP